MTYDVEQRSRRSPAAPPPALVALLIGVLAVTVMLVAWTMKSPTTEDAGGTQPVAETPSTAARVTPSTSGSAPLVQAGSDAGEAAQTPGGSAEAAAAFVAAWLEDSADERGPALEKTAAPGLVEQLKMTSQGNIPEAEPDGDPMLDEASAYSVSFVQTLSDGSEIRIYLVSDPEADHGWLATSVEEVGEG